MQQSLGLGSPPIPPPLPTRTPAQSETPSPVSPAAIIPAEFSDFSIRTRRVSIAERSGFAPARSILDIFDIHFERYVTPIIVRITWMTALVLAGLWLIVLLVLGVYTWTPDSAKKPSEDPRVAALRNRVQPRTESELSKWLEPRKAATIVLIHAAIAAVLALLWLRVVLESVIVLFHMAKSLASIDRKTAGA
jgi:hypothetical protein